MRIFHPLETTVKFRNATFLLFTLIVLALFYDPLRQLVNVAFAYAHNSHLILIPGISAYLIFINRKRVFSNTHPYPFLGTLILLAGFLFYLVGKWSGLRPYPPENPLYYNNNDYLSFMIFCFLTSLVGGLIFFYGVQAFRSASFEICFLIFMVPLPPSLLGGLTWILQMGAVETTHSIFQGIGTPVFREGVILYLPRLALEIAPACSGIRSGQALFILSILVGHGYLRTKWTKLSLMLLVFPVTVFKNGIRIVAFYFITAYLDNDFLAGTVHLQAGIPLFLLALVFLTPIFLLLRKMEGHLCHTEDWPLLESVKSWSSQWFSRVLR